MKKMPASYSQLILLTLFLCFSLPVVHAQQRGKKPEKVALKDRLWYGGNLGLGFSSSNLDGGLQGNIFFLGVSPMVGYKFNEWLSAGPRLDFQWYTGRFREFGSGPIYRFNAINLGAGVFTRAKVFRQFFLHGEYGVIQYTFPVSIDYLNNRINTEKELIDQFLVGAGINFGGQFSSEIALLYNLLAPDDTVDLPIVFRYGFTYNF